jgi:hypothetical protein
VRSQVRSKKARPGWIRRCSSSKGRGERWFDAELNRQRGSLLLRQGHPEAAEELYRKTLGIAREQEAKLWV